MLVKRLTVAAHQSDLLALLDGRPDEGYAILHRSPELSLRRHLGRPRIARSMIAKIMRSASVGRRSSSSDRLDAPRHDRASSLLSSDELDRSAAPPNYGIAPLPRASSPSPQSRRWCRRRPSRPPGCPPPSPRLLPAPPPAPAPTARGTSGTATTLPHREARTRDRRPCALAVEVHALAAHRAYTITSGPAPPADPLVGTLSWQG